MTFWQPASLCGTHCFTDATTVGLPRRAARFLALAAVVGAGALTLPLLPARSRPAALRRLARGALRGMGIRVVLRGSLPARRALLVANHVSWLDILVLLAVGRCALVAKTEVRDWPVIGRVAAGTGTVFIDRSRPKALPGTVAAVRTRLAGDAVMAAFPEGTTSCGQAVGAFRPALFQAALDAGAVVVPVSLRFGTPADARPATTAAFIGAENLLSSLRRILATRDLSVRVHAGTAIHPDTAATRAALARLAGDAVRAEWPARTPGAPATQPLPHPPSTGRVPHLTLLEGASGAAAQRIPTGSGSGESAGLSPAA